MNMQNLRALLTKLMSRRIASVAAWGPYKNSWIKVRIWVRKFDRDCFWTWNRSRKSTINLFRDTSQSHVNTFHKSPHYGPPSYKTRIYPPSSFPSPSRRGLLIFFRHRPTPAMTSTSVLAASDCLLVAFFVCFRNPKASSASLPLGPKSVPLLGSIFYLTPKELLVSRSQPDVMGFF